MENFHFICVCMCVYVYVYVCMCVCSYCIFDSCFDIFVLHILPLSPLNFFSLTVSFSSLSFSLFFSSLSFSPLLLSFFLLSYVLLSSTSPPPLSLFLSRFLRSKSPIINCLPDTKKVGLFYRFIYHFQGFWPF